MTDYNHNLKKNVADGASFMVFAGKQKHTPPYALQLI